MTFAYKSSNMHQLAKDEHKNSTTKDEINKKGKEILTNEEVLSRIDINEESECFLTLDDIKGNFQNNPTVKLINPQKIRLEDRVRLIFLKSCHKLFFRLFILQRLYVQC